MSSKDFSIILGSKDADNINTTETVQVRAGAPHFDAPQVGFTFPPQVAVRLGNASGPYWPVDQALGFAYCRVVPTPSEDGTGRFFVQYYYDSGNWPNNPSRRFHETFEGLGTTLNDNLYSYTTNSINVNAGGGVSPYGFASANDLSGIRHAIVFTDADLSYVYQGQIGTRTFVTGGDRAGFRNPGTDDVIAIYKDDQIQSKFLTLERLEAGYLSDNVTQRTWTLGTQIIAHPYHYVPMYTNNSVAAIPFLPRVLVIEEGAQFPLTGFFNISGSTASGIYTALMSEVASGAQMAVRVTGDNVWYLVSGVQSDNGMILHTYNSNPYFISGALEAAPYAIGSGLISVLPNLSGCENWDVALSPDLRDGSSVVNPSAVTFTANLVAVNPGGAPSGTIGYRWEVQTQGGPITTITNSGNQINVNFSGLIRDVRVFVSGTGVAGCIHSDSTGYISLQKLIDAGTWFKLPSSDLATSTNDLRSNHSWVRTSTTSDTSVFYHHQMYAYNPHMATLTAGGSTLASYISVKKGTIDKWPTAGTFVLAWAPNSFMYLIYGVYSGKQTGTTDDRLTGVNFQRGLSLTSSYKALTKTSPIAYSTYPSYATLYMPVPGSWPFAFVGSRISNTQINIEGSWGSYLLSFARRSVGMKFWFFKPGYPIHTNSGGASTNGFVFATALPSWVDAGTIITLSPWSAGNEDTVPSSSWNIGNIAFLYATPTSRMFVDGTTTFSLKIVDATMDIYKKKLTNELPEYTWLPFQGKIVVPNSDRTKTMVISYQSYTIDPTVPSGNTEAITLLNCRVIQVNGSASSGYIESPQWLALFKDVDPDPVPYVKSIGSFKASPTLKINDPGIPNWFLGFNQTFVNVVKANLSPTNSQATGVIGTPANPTNWESILSNYPAGGMIMSDPLYRQPATPSTVYYNYTASLIGPIIA